MNTPNLSPAKPALLPAQFGVAVSADFESSTWTLEMRAGYRVAPGAFAVLPKDTYDELIDALQMAKHIVVADGSREQQDQVFAAIRNATGAAA